MRDFFNSFFLLAIPVFLLVIGLTFLMDRNRFNREVDRAKPAIVAERIITASKVSELRNTDLGQRTSAGSTSIPQQIYREVKEAFSSLDQVVQKSLSGTFGFSPAGADFASTLLAWGISLLALIAAGSSLFSRWAPSSIRQRLITGNTGAQARTGGSFELPH